MVIALESFEDDVWLGLDRACIQPCWDFGILICPGSTRGVVATALPATPKRGEGGCRRAGGDALNASTQRGDYNNADRIPDFDSGYIDRRRFH